MLPEGAVHRHRYLTEHDPLILVFSPEPEPP